MNGIEKSEFEIDHNVYILGTGFCHAARIPLLDNFIEIMRQVRVELGSKEKELEIEEERDIIKKKIKAIDNVLKFRLDAAKASYYINTDLNNLENLLSLVAAMPKKLKQEKMSEVFLKKAVPLAIGSTLDYQYEIYSNLKWPDNSGFKVITVQDANNIKEKLKANPIDKWENIPNEQGNYSIPLYDYYLAHMTGFLEKNSNQLNTFITFNYDMVIEDAFSRMGIDFNYGFENSNKIEFNTQKLKAQWSGVANKPTIPLLKLHGSINWGIKDDDMDKNNLLIFDDFKGLLKNGSYPLIEPPTWKKNQYGVLSEVWEKAVSSLQTATRIIIIGYSCPKTDPYFQFLLAAGLTENISLTKILVVDPNKDGYSRVMEMFSSNKSTNKCVIPVSYIPLYSETLAYFGINDHNHTLFSDIYINRPLNWVKSQALQKTVSIEIN